MRTSKRHSFHRILFALGIALPGLIGILAAQAKAVTNETVKVAPALQAQVTSTVTSTPTPPLTATLPFQTSTVLPLASLPSLGNLLPSGLYAFIEAPIGTVPQPYVILSAFSALPTQISVTIPGV